MTRTVYSPNWQIQRQWPVLKETDDGAQALSCDGG